MERAVPHRASESHVSTPLLNVGHNDGLRTDGVVDETTRSSIVVSDGFAHCLVATITTRPRLQPETSPLDRGFSQKRHHHSTEAPASDVTTRPRLRPATSPPEDRGSGQQVTNHDAIHSTTTNTVIYKIHTIIVIKTKTTRNPPTSLYFHHRLRSLFPNFVTSLPFSLAGQTRLHQAINQPRQHVLRNSHT